MRTTALLLVLVCATTPALAAPARAKRTPMPPAQTGAQRTFYDGLSLADRIALQSDLTWSGDYNGLANGEFGERSIAAVKAFQKRQGNAEIGILNPQERATLAALAKSKQDKVGWRTVTDPATGAQVGMPAKLVPQPVPAKSGSRWESAHGDVRIETFRDFGATLGAVFNREKSDPARRVEYSVLKPDFFVIAGLQGLKLFYMRGEAKGEEVRGVIIMHDQAIDGIMAPVVVAMSSAFNAFPAASSNPARRPAVEYASGVIVSSAGDIVTDRTASEDCATLTIAGIGTAERVAHDDGSGLALLRVYGARNLKALPLGDRRSEGEATLVGIADPQMQAGGAAVSTTKARVLSGADIENPALGFAGGAAIDSNAGFVGVITQNHANPNAGLTTAIASTDAVRALMRAKGIAPNAGRADVELAKAAVVRVICVRQ
jgi:peptidoglycan hydrolase-like protein with peptidoglycan-binding domain